MTARAVAADDRAAAFEADLLAGPTATAVLERWSGGRVHAEVVERREGFRRVRLMRGATVLSVADNHFRAAALTLAMQAELEGSDRPFGAVIAPLGPHREVIGIVRGGRPGFLHVRARVLGADGTLLAEVSEVYQDAVLRMKPA